MKLPDNLKKAAKIRMDYNENHDEKGRFSVTSSDSGAGTKVSNNVTHHATLREAHGQAKTTSRMYGTSTFHVRDNDKIVAAYHQGVQHSITTGESYGRRVTKSKDPLADIPTKPTPSAAARASATRTFIAQTSRDLEAKDARRAAIKSSQQDYNENHDEQGRFSASASDGSDRKMHTTSTGAKIYAKAQSSVTGKTYQVHEHGNGDASLLGVYRGGKDVTMGAKKVPTDRTGTRYGGYNSKQAKMEKQDLYRAKSQSVSRNEQVGRQGAKPGDLSKPGETLRIAPGPKYKVVSNSVTGMHGVFSANGHSPLSEHKDKAVAEKRAASKLSPSPTNKEELRQSILKQKAAMVAKDVKSSESPAGAAMRAKQSVADHFTDKSSATGGTYYKHNTSGAVINKVNGTWRVNRPDGKGSLGGSEDMYRHEHLERAMHDVHDRAQRS